MKLPARLVRDVVTTDGSGGKETVRYTESVDVQIVWPSGFIQEPNAPYSIVGEWRIADYRGGIVSAEKQ